MNITETYEYLGYKHHTQLDINNIKKECWIIKMILFDFDCLFSL